MRTIHIENTGLIAEKIFEIAWNDGFLACSKTFPMDPADVLCCDGQRREVARQATACQRGNLMNQLFGERALTARSASINGRKYDS